jgi:flagellar hook-length control protein FliK
VRVGANPPARPEIEGVVTASPDSDAEQFLAVLAGAPAPDRARGAAGAASGRRAESGPLDPDRAPDRTPLESPTDAEGGATPEATEDSPGDAPPATGAVATLVSPLAPGVPVPPEPATDAATSIALRASDVLAPAGHETDTVGAVESPSLPLTSGRIGGASDPREVPDVAAGTAAVTTDGRAAPQPSLARAAADSPLASLGLDGRARHGVAASPNPDPAQVHTGRPGAPEANAAPGAATGVTATPAGDLPPAASAPSPLTGPDLLTPADATPPVVDPSQAQPAASAPGLVVAATSRPAPATNAATSAVGLPPGATAPDPDDIGPGAGVPGAGVADPTTPGARRVATPGTPGSGAALETEPPGRPDPPRPATPSNPPSPSDPPSPTTPPGPLSPSSAPGAVAVSAGAVERAGAGESAGGAGGTATPAPSPGAQIAGALGALRRTRGGAHVLTIELDPPELGRVRLELRSRGGELSVRIEPERGSTGLLLRSGLDDLSEHLADLGVAPGDVSVEDGWRSARDDHPDDAGPEGADPQQVGPVSPVDRSAALDADAVVDVLI